MPVVNTPTTLLELIDVRKSYRFGATVVNALDGVSFRLDEGAFLGVIGRSGSGKSTLLNILGGLDRPSAGQLLVKGRPLGNRGADELAAYRRDVVGFIFQSFNLIPHLTALENVALPLRLARKGGFFERRRRAQELLERVGLGARIGHRPSELSGGERQRVAIARSLANDPMLLLADEPTGNLDSKTAQEIMAMLRDLHEVEKRTIILVTHDSDQAEAYCDRLVILQDGMVQEDRHLRGARGEASVEAEQEPAPEPEPTAGAGAAEGGGDA